MPKTSKPKGIGATARAKGKSIPLHEKEGIIKDSEGRATKIGTSRPTATTRLPKNPRLIDVTGTAPPIKIRKPSETKPDKFVHPHSHAQQARYKAKGYTHTQTPTNRNTRVPAPFPHGFRDTFDDRYHPDWAHTANYEPHTPWMAGTSSTGSAGFPSDINRMRAFGQERHGNFQAMTYREWEEMQAAQQAQQQAANQAQMRQQIQAARNAALDM
jgi:hypothetical protein